MILWNDYSSADIAWNVAADEALLTACEQNLLGVGSALRVWRQNSWAVVLGASGKMAQEVYAERCHQAGVPIARRSSGGGTVLLGPGTLCVSWVRPLADFAVAERGVRELQVAMLEELASVFRMDRPALDVIAAGDWALDGRKCAGSAQRRQKTHVLVHMSLLNQTDLTMISRLLPPPPRMPDYRAERTHDQFLTNFDLPPNRFIERLSDYWPAADLFFDTPLPVKNLTNTLAEDRFRLAEWTMRF